MEPKRSPALPQPNVETKKSPPRAAAGGGGGGTAAVGGESPLSSLFHQPSHGAKGKEDIYSIFYKGQNGTAQAGTADGKSQWTPPKSRTVYTKDNKQSNQYDSVDTSCFGSSVNYGGRDYYGISGHKQSTESNDYKADKKDPSTDSHGDWWQGSFYY
ncbi:unknown protein [Oryza sativa Japonica Group]|uniref:Os01g0848900 protein n=2 Tax=Oryza sativa subsp. japonica TaxID=39947 RepID=A0A5S6RDP8_ORYSJ|nr:uncharacterized protein LOC4324857 isoform X1 [Oryza sativa Japonica Group]KAB8084304.1 hypothetical protein EE612_006831 [Oryza sativa]BAD82673.1 unknown protein [Oryza sativa Japonica Group]BAF06720.2 Os01g0848900 [Oryza sativa Japonica Group]BAS75228.1 Os01g0848900 [Oryza sativa Japonica Group]|eukprot:NP_001044806.2 Os01g0848900 [Oryza sativa Japonica Group]